MVCFLHFLGTQGWDMVSLGKEVPWYFDRPVSETPLGREQPSEVMMVSNSGGVCFIFTIF